MGPTDQGMFFSGWNLEAIILYTSIHMLHFFFPKINSRSESSPMLCVAEREFHPLDAYVIGRFFLNLREEHESHSKVSRLIYLTLYCIQHENGAWIRIHLFFSCSKSPNPLQRSTVQCAYCNFLLFGRGGELFFSNILTICTNLENNIVRCVVCTRHKLLLSVCPPFNGVSPDIPLLQRSLLVFSTPSKWKGSSLYNCTQNLPPPTFILIIICLLK